MALKCEACNAEFDNGETLTEGFLCSKQCEDKFYADYAKRVNHACAICLSVECVCVCPTGWDSVEA